MTSKNEKKSFVMYDSFLEAMKHLNDSEFRECVMKIRNYALEGDETESEHPMVNVIMAMAKPNLDAAKRRYMASVENGKKGAEFGKLGGAPKGNQNARKKQPLNQPLDVDANDNVDVEEDVNEEVDVNGDAPLGSIGFHSSFSNSSIGLLENKIENDSERFEREEKKEPLKEVNPCQSNDLVVGTASEGKEETIYSKRNSNNISSDSTASDKGVMGVAARLAQKKEPGMSTSEYLHQCYRRNLETLTMIRLGQLPADDTLFWRTVDIHKQIFPRDDNNTAIKDINKLVNDAARLLQ